MEPISTKYTFSQELLCRFLVLVYTTVRFHSAMLRNVSLSEQHILMSTHCIDTN